MKLFKFRPHIKKLIALNAIRDAYLSCSPTYYYNILTDLYNISRFGYQYVNKNIGFLFDYQPYIKV